MLEKKEVLLIVYLIAVVVIIAVFAIVFFVFFHKRKNKLLVDRLEAEKRFEDELVKSKLEIQEQTLKNVSWELHDNIGQLLSTAVMHINVLGNVISSTNKEAVEEVRELVGGSLQEIRSLSKTLNNEVIQNVGLEQSIRTELERFEKLNFLTTKLEVIGDERLINPKDEIILYRIVQEFFSNTIKHSEATNLNVLLDFGQSYFRIKMNDDGVGYEPKSVTTNSGLLNMKSRAVLINTNFILTTTPGKGVELELQYPFEKELTIPSEEL